MMSDDPLPGLFWFAITRLGESEILLPAFMAAALWLALAHPALARSAGWTGDARAHPVRAEAWRWLAGIVGGTAVTTASKIAFLGFGIGSATLDFTGFSGHSMYSMAVFPVLFAIVFGRGGALCGAVLALIVMVSRVLTGAHSWSEAISGMALGAAIAAWPLVLYLRHPSAVRAPWWLPAVLAAWLILVPWRGPPSHSHQLVLALSLKLSGRTQPYTRHELLHGEIHRLAAAVDSAEGLDPDQPAMQAKRE